MSEYLFDMEGEAIAFRRAWNDPYVFALDGAWIGWCPWEDHHVVDRHGEYLGSVVDDRLVRRNDWFGRVCDRAPTDPGHVEPSGRPRAPHLFPNCFAYEDVRLPHHA